MNAVAIIQARMGSTRLPGKVLMPLAGRPLLWHIIYRLQQCEKLDRIVIATTKNPEDDALEAFGKEHDILVVRGSQDNVLRRYGQAARATRAGIVVRITGDSPLIDPVSIDHWVDALQTSGSDLVRTRGNSKQIHEGICVFSRGALDFLLRSVPGDPVAREHVSSYFRDHPGEATITRVDADPRHEFDGARISVDTPADFEFMEAVYRESGAAAGELDVVDLVQLLKSRPELMEINAHVRQKAATEQTRRVLVRCRGERALERGLALGGLLRDRAGFGVLLAMDAASEGNQEGFPAEVLRREEEESGWLSGVLERARPDATILIEESGAILAALDRVGGLELCCGSVRAGCHALGDLPETASLALLSIFASQQEQEAA